jgi:hypothetical protein
MRGEGGGQGRCSVVEGQEEVQGLKKEEEGHINGGERDKEQLVGAISVSLNKLLTFSA